MTPAQWKEAFRYLVQSSEAVEAAQQAVVDQDLKRTWECFEFAESALRAYRVAVLEVELGERERQLPEVEVVGKQHKPEDDQQGSLF